MAIFISDAIGEEQLPFGLRILGREAEHRSFKRLSGLYAASLDACGFRVVSVFRPEIYQTEIARDICGVEPGDWHLAVKPIAHLRPFHGMKNVFVWDGPFADLSGDRGAISFFQDDVRLLGQADAVLCWSPFATDVLRQAGIERARTLPPHIPMQNTSTKRKRAAGERKLVQFATVINLSRQTGSLTSILEGFAKARRDGMPVSLTVRVTTAGVKTSSELAEEAYHRIGIDAAVAFVTEPAFDPESTDQVTDADFFLQLDSAPGLPLALIDAMRNGIPPVLIACPSLSNVMFPDGFVAIETQSDVPPLHDEMPGRIVGPFSRPATVDAVHTAIKAAVAINDASRSAMAQTCREAIKAQFGLETFRAEINALDETLRRSRP